MRTHFEELLAARGGDIAAHDVETFMYMSYWYAALYVVIEGWRELRLRDEDIDRLLESENVDLLRRYRNGVFHFQQEYYDERFLQFIREGQVSAAWVRELNQAFGRYFLEWIRDVGG
jgi:hypothetical protein